MAGLQHDAPGILDLRVGSATAARRTCASALPGEPIGRRHGCSVQLRLPTTNCCIAPYLLAMHTPSALSTLVLVCQHQTSTDSVHQMPSVSGGQIAWQGMSRTGVGGVVQQHEPGGGGDLWHAPALALHVRLALFEELQRRRQQLPASLLARICKPSELP